MAKALRILGFKVYDYPEHRDFRIDEWLGVYLEGKSLDFTSMYKGADALTARCPAIVLVSRNLQSFS